MSYFLITTVGRAFLINNSSTILKNSIRTYSYCSQRLAPTALLLLADGAEDLEATTVVDVLRRGNVNVTVGGVCGAGPVKCRCGVRICPDIPLHEAAKKTYDAIIMPGGIEGSKTLCASSVVRKMLQDQDCNNRIIAAICAAPTALKAHNIAKGKAITSYPSPGTAGELKKGGIYIFKDDCPVVIDKHIITSRGPATAMIFALAILEQMQGKDRAEEVAKALLYKY